MSYYMSHLSTGTYKLGGSMHDGPDGVRFDEKMCAVQLSRLIPPQGLRPNTCFGEKMVLAA